MKYYLNIILFFLSFGNLQSQNSAPLSASQFFSVNRARFEPAVLGSDFNNFQIGIIGSYLWAGNSTFKWKELEPVVREDKKLRELTNGFKSDNQAGLEAFVEPLHLGFKITKKTNVPQADFERKIWCPGQTYGKEIVTLSFGVAERAQGSGAISGNMVKAWYGRSLSDISNVTTEYGKFNGFYSREWIVGVAAPLEMKNPRGFWKEVYMRWGLRVKYLQGIAAFSTQEGEGRVSLGNQGNLVLANYAFNFYTLDFKDFNPLESKGRGLALDVGVTINYRQNWFASLNFLDFGNLKFDKEVINFQAEGSLDPFNVDQFNLQEIFKASKRNLGEEGSFSVPYPSRLRIQGGFRLPAYDAYGRLYARHLISATVVQHLTDFSYPQKGPYLGTSYVFNWKNFLELGVNGELSTFSGLEAGVLMAARVGFFRLGVATSKVMPLLSGNGYEGDLAFQLTCSF